MIHYKFGTMPHDLLNESRRESLASRDPGRHAQNDLRLNEDFLSQHFAGLDERVPIMDTPSAPLRCHD